MAKKLDLFLSIFGKDQTGGMFSSVLGKANGLKDSMGGVTGSMRDGMLQAELFTKALDIGLGVATAGAGALKDAFTSAVETEQSLLSVSNNYAAITGVSFDKAEASIGRVNERLTAAAASLPGQTKGYRDLSSQIADNVLPAFMGIAGLDVQGAENSLVGLSTAFGLLGASAGVGTEDISKGLSKALSGKSISELGDLIFFEQNPAILSEIENQLKVKNVESLKDLDQKARLDLIQGVGTKFSSPEYLDKISKTTSSLLEGFSSTLFDQSVGVFGLMRDLDSKTKGSQSVYQQMGFTLDLIIGPSGVFGASGPVSKLFQAMGIELPDPMRLLYNGLQKTVGFLEGAVEIGNDIAERIQKGQTVAKSFGRYFRLDLGAFSGGQVGELIGRNLRQGVTFVSGAIARIPWRTIGTEGGAFLGAGIVSIFRNFPWLPVLGAVGKAVVAAANFLNATIQGILKGIALEIGDWIKDSATSAIRAIGPGLMSAGRGAVQSASNLGRNAASGLGNALSGQASPATVSTGRGRRARRAAEGYEPDHIMALVAAEQAAAPSESIVIANSGERVIPRGATGNQSLSAGSRGQQGGSSARTVSVSFSPTLVLPQGSTRQMAEEVLKHLNALVGESLESQLA